MKMYTIPAQLIGKLRCPKCLGIHFKTREDMVEESILDMNGFPIQTYEYGDSYMECLNCHMKFSYMGNGIDGFMIDDGTHGIPEFEPESVQFNPFYRTNNIVEG